MHWLRENAEALQAIGALMTAALALVALVGVKWQLDNSHAVAEAQSAREIYRDYLALSIQYPEFASPQTCPNFTENQQVSYQNYVEYMLYTAEQVVGADQDWLDLFENAIEAHPTFFCDGSDWSGYTEEVQALIQRATLKICAEVSPCDTND